ncbi:MAG TPA: DUF2585 domain-containing protein [Chakrabartia sp.]|jgi:hypothetical protein|nr:DUF2585 domain-containing protein [Chakrabartia sp.]
MGSITRKHWLAWGGVLLLALLILTAMGRPPICTCGTVKLWEGEVFGPGNSQHLSDWYSFSHAIHGFLFYALGWWLYPRLEMGWRLVIAAGLEMTWEILENSPMMIERYRSATAAFGYSGDSMLNSMADGVTMTAGFLLALRLPWKVSVALCIAAELFTAYMVRDNLTLNVLMLAWPVDAIKAWQAAA